MPMQCLLNLIVLLLAHVFTDESVSEKPKGGGTFLSDSQDVIVFQWEKATGEGGYISPPQREMIDEMTIARFPSESYLERLYLSAFPREETCFFDPRKFCFVKDETIYQCVTPLCEDYCGVRNNKLARLTRPNRCDTSQWDSPAFFCWESSFSTKHSVAVLKRITDWLPLIMDENGNVAVQMDSLHQEYIIAFMRKESGNGGRATVYFLSPDDASKRGCFIAKYPDVPFIEQKVSLESCVRKNVQGYTVYLSPFLTEDGRIMVDWLNEVNEWEEAWRIPRGLRDCWRKLAAWYRWKDWSRTTFIEMRRGRESEEWGAGRCHRVAPLEAPVGMMLANNSMPPFFNSKRESLFFSDIILVPIIYTVPFRPTNTDGKANEK